MIVLNLAGQNGGKNYGRIQMGNFGHVIKTTMEVGGKTYTFRSLLEYRWAVWRQLEKEQGFIADWWYEDAESVQELVRANGNIKNYHPDFTILYPNGDYELEETKGWFPAKDYTTLRMVADQCDIPLTLIFARTPKFDYINGVICNCNAKSQKTLAQIRRAVRIEKHIKRVIWNANKDIFQKISHLFEV